MLIVGLTNLTIKSLVIFITPLLVYIFIGLLSTTFLLVDEYIISGLKRDTILINN